MHTRSGCAALVRRVLRGACAAGVCRGAHAAGTGYGGTLKLRKLRLPAHEYRRCRGRLTGSGNGAVAADASGPVAAGVRHSCWLGDAGAD